MFGIFAVFNKTNSRERLTTTIFNAWGKASRLNLFYGTGNVDFSVDHRFPGNDGYLTERQSWC